MLQILNCFFLILLGFVGFLEINGRFLLDERQVETTGVLVLGHHTHGVFDLDLGHEFGRLGEHARSDNVFLIKVAVFKVILEFFVN